MSTTYKEDNVIYVTIPTPHPLTYPAPKVCWERTEHGFSSHPWTIDDVNFAMTAGAWFQKGSHVFDRQSTAEYAYAQSAQQ